LVGFKGDLQRVAFLIDNSGSMKDRWPDAKQRVMNWITALDIKECVVMTFSDSHSVIKYPENEFSYSLSGELKQQSIEEIRQVLQKTKPAGVTDTYKALKVAYAFSGIDTIVLFTDGAPYLGDKDYEFEGKQRRSEVRVADGIRYDNFLINAAEELCRQNSHIPVNVVGVGEFFEPTFAGFLLQLAKISDGTFLGRGD
jgi:hypothetical protein